MNTNVRTREARQLRKHSVVARQAFMYRGALIECGEVFALRGPRRADSALVVNRLLSVRAVRSSPPRICLCGKAFATTDDLTQHHAQRCLHPVITRLTERAPQRVPSDVELRAWVERNGYDPFTGVPLEP